MKTLHLPLLRPAPCLLLFQICLILLGSVCRERWHLFGPMLFLAFGLWGMLWQGRRRCALISLLLGLRLLSCFYSALPNYFPEFEKSLSFRGEIMACSEREGVWALCKLESGGRVLLKKPAKEWTIGMQLQAKAVIRAIRGPRNPGSFDERRWLRSLGALGVIEAKKFQMIDCQVKKAFYLEAWRLHFRNKLQKALETSLGQESGLALAFLSGGRELLTAEDAQAFRASGLAHLLAVSGLHVSLLMRVLAFLMKRWRQSSPWRLLFLTCPLLFWSWLCGWPSSLLRAAICCFLHEVRVGRTWRQDLRQDLALAAIVVLFLEPFRLFSYGFCLSFGSVLALRLLSQVWLPVFDTYCPRLEARLRRRLAAILTLQAMLFLIQVIFMGTYNALSLFLNPPAIALAALAFPALLACLPLLLCGRLPELFAQILRLLFISLRYLATQGAENKIFLYHLEGLNWALFLLVLALSFETVLRFSHSGGADWGRYALRLSLPFLLMLQLFAWIWPGPRDIWIFDVGQGDAILIRERGYTMLIDGGTEANAKQELLPALDRLGVKRINLAVITHAHADHADGIRLLLEAGRIARLAVPNPWVNDEKKSAYSLQALRHLAEKSACRFECWRMGENRHLAGALSCYVLAPDQNAAESCDPNEASLVLALRLAQLEIILTGDMTANQEANLLRRGVPDCAILKIAHHGSKSASSSSFLAAVKPEAAVISVGENPYGHPSREVCQRLRDQSCPYLRTDQKGAICLQPREKIVWIWTCLEGKSWRLRLPKGEKNGRIASENVSGRFEADSD